MSTRSILSRFGFAALVLSSFAVGCGDSSDGGGGGGGVGGNNAPVSLGASGGYVILAKSGITNVPTSAITGNVGVSPIDSTAIVGFDPITPGVGTTSGTSLQIAGLIYASDYSEPTPTNLIAAVDAMGLAYTTAAGRAAGLTELGAGSIGGKNLTPGVYKWSSGLLIPSDITFTGNSSDVWILQIAQGLNVSDGVRVHLSGGALAKNITWQVAGAVTLGTTAHLEGVVLCQTAITLGTGATVNGRLLAQMAVTLSANTVMQPAP